MLMFPSDEWCKVFADVLNNSPEHARDGKNYVGTDIWVVLPDEGLDKPVRMFFSFDHGKVLEACVLPEGEERAVDSITSAPLSVWRKMNQRKLNPIPALVRGQIKIEGRLGLAQTMREIKFVQSIFDHALRIQAEFPS